MKFCILLLLIVGVSTCWACTEGCKKNSAEIRWLGEVKDPNGNWSYCVEVLGENLCVVAFADPDTLAIGFEFTLNGQVIFEEEFNGSNICLDQDALLKLLELIPALAPFKSVIDEVIKLLHYLPAEVFSVCLQLSDVKTSETDFYACFNLDLTLVCWEGKCAYKKNEDLGCHDIPF